MYGYFKETLEKIDKFQEDCAELTFAVKKLIGEDCIEENSIADIAVSKVPACNLKKKIIEADDTEKDIEPEADIEVDTEPEADENVDSLDDEENINRVKRAEKNLDGILGDLVNKYFEQKYNGNFGESRVTKKKIEKIIKIKDLDREIVYHGLKKNIQSEG